MLNVVLFYTEKPLATWSESTNGIAVRRIEWAWHHPGMFMVLAADSTLYLWSVNKTGLIIVHGIMQHITFSFVFYIHV